MSGPFHRVNTWWTTNSRTILIALSAVLIFLVGLDVMTRIDLNRQNEALGTAVDKQRDSSEKAGAPVVVPNSKEIKENPSVVQGAKGDQGDPGEPGPGPTAAEISKAVSLYCENDRCKGAPGTPGKSVTPQQVANAVALYCSANGKCQGPSGAVGKPGADGTPGLPGKDGQDGKDGQNATAEQIATAVASYCADGRCKGEPGKDGTDGTDGKDGTDGAAGPAGPAGPVCPEGFASQKFWIDTYDTDEPPSLATRRLVLICVPV